MLSRIWAITQKEFIQVLRDRVTLVLLLTLPLVELILFAAAIHTDIRHIPMAVADQSNSPESRAYLNALITSGSFDTSTAVSGQAELIQAIDSGRVNLGVLIPPDFASQVKLRQAVVLMLVDGSSSFTTRSAYSTANAISQSYAISLIQKPVNPLNLNIRILYNPDAKDLWFFLPGLLTQLVQGLALSLTALAVVREREVGTIEALLVTPIRPVELMVGKAIPNLVIALLDTGSILLVGVLVFDVPFQGNVALFFVLAILFAFSGLGLGLVVSVIAQNQMQAQYLGAMFSFVGAFLGGFLFPVNALPSILRWIGSIFPMTYFIPIARGIFTKGVGIEALWSQVASLGVLLVVILFATSRLYRKSLD